MPKYVDGYVLIVPKDKADDYRKMAEMGKETWLKCGALQYFECCGDELQPKEMGGESNRDFREMAGASSTEDVWFSFIIFESKAHRDEVNAKVMKEMDESMAEYKDFVMPFDMKRMAYGGFQAVVEG